MSAQHMVSCRWSFETVILSRMIAETLYAKHLAKHIPIESALIPMFVFGENWGLHYFATLCV